jgi:RNA polymerase sigma-70 factor (ECF subfamily)
MSQSAHRIPTDEQLAEAIAVRQESAEACLAARAACRELYDRHSRSMLAFLSARIGRDDLEDAHQEIWQRVWRHLTDGFRGGNFRAWMYQLARNYLIDLSRKRRPQAVQNVDSLADHRLERPDEVAEQRERMMILARCLARLANNLAEIFRARLAGEDYQEICRHMELTEAQAHKLFHQAKTQLQSCVRRSLA